MPVSVSILNMQHNNFVIFYWKEDNWRASEASEPLSCLIEIRNISESTVVLSM